MIVFCYNMFVEGGILSGTVLLKALSDAWNEKLFRTCEYLP